MFLLLLLTGAPLHDSPTITSSRATMAAFPIALLLQFILIVSAWEKDHYYQWSNVVAGFLMESVSFSLLLYH